jgi:hypothetical protein
LHTGSQLCDTCSAVDFATYFQPPNHGEAYSENSIGVITYKERDLGGRDEIKFKAKHCAFCYLAYTATDVERFKVADDAVVSISSFCWGGNRDSASTGLIATYCIRVMARVQDRGAVGYIQLLADDANRLGLPSCFRARIPRGAGFEMAQARTWLEICRTDHGSLCSTPGRNPDERKPSPQPLDLLAIDIVDMSLCCMPQGSDFIALSYCWPAISYMTLKRANCQELFAQNALLDNMHLLPGTVQDAIKCAQELPFQYLWIDALCIIQDDKDHKEKQLRQMDRVYSCASLTIVCAYPVARGSNDPCDGLPGYRKPNQDRERNAKLVGGLRMMVVSPCVDEVLNCTRWDTRCWTFQEHHLSRRLLYFTPTQVYFQCSCNAFCEDIVSENVSRSAYKAPGSTLWSLKVQYSVSEDKNDEWGQWTLSRAPLRTVPDIMESYVNALRHYTYRDVSYPSDILNAFEGVRAVLSEAMHTSFWKGMPESILAQALCWMLSGQFRRRRSRPPGQPPSKPLFPSWSWAGWESRVDLNNFMAINTYQSEAEWFIINEDSVATRLNVLNQGVPFHYSQHRPASISNFLPQIVPRQEVDATSEKWRDARILACWTTCASFLLDGSRHLLDTQHERLWPESANYAIKDVQGVTAGCILLPKDFITSHGVQSLECDFILISKSLRQRQTKFQKSLQYFDETVYTLRDWCTLNVMLISRLGEYKALRVGVGIIHEDAWINAKPGITFVKLV